VCFTNIILDIQGVPYKVIQYRYIIYVLLFYSKSQAKSLINTVKKMLFFPKNIFDS